MSQTTELEVPTATKASKRRVRKAFKSHLPPKETPLAENIPGDLAAKKADEEAAAENHRKSVNEDAAFVTKVINLFGEKHCAKEFEALEAYEDAKLAARNYFSTKFRDPEFRKKIQNVRDFFGVRNSDPRYNYLLGADGVTRYKTAKSFFNGECAVSYEYVRKLGKKYETVIYLDGSKPQPPQKPQPKQDLPPFGDTEFHVPEEKTDATPQAATATQPQQEETDTKAEETKTDATTFPIPSLSSSIEDRVRFAQAYAVKCTKHLSPSEKDEFYSSLIAKLEDEAQDDLRTITIT